MSEASFEIHTGGSQPAHATNKLRELVVAHLGGATPDAVVTASRTYPGYFRVDLNRALERMLPRDRVRCVGLPPVARCRFAELVSGGMEMVPMSPAPLQYDDIDIGEERPVRCLQWAMWLVPAPAPHLLLLTATPAVAGGGGCHIERSSSC